MDKCADNGGPVLCFADALLFAISVSILCLTVPVTQVWLVAKRLSHPRKWRTAKSAIFYSILLENLSTSIELWMVKDAATLLHLAHDYAKFLLFTCVFYYFAIHAFQILGSSRTAKTIIWSLASLNALYLSGFSVYIAYDLSQQTKTSYCKCNSHLAPIWLTMCAGDCVISVVLVGVGVFARHVLKMKLRVQNKRREKKLWCVIWVLIISSYIELAYDTYDEVAKPNRWCVGLLPASYNDANAIIWLVHKLITSVLVDTSALFAFWPTKKQHSPLLKETDDDDYGAENDLQVIIRQPASKTVSSDSGLSYIDEDKSPELPSHARPRAS